ncbi:MAG: hypothetical protein OEU94_00665 [Aquincola sp.]|nr:hypothetical protein [Aquincola sp.]MDH4290392.1 hypothetical protein [Aquincola sp.]
MNVNSPATASAALVVDEVQLRYARLLDWGTRIGLAALLVSFAIYNTGLFPSKVPRHRLPELWSEPIARYLELTGAPAGWQWVTMLQHGDVLGLVGIAVLAGCSGVCLLSLLPMYLRRGDRAYLGLCLAQAAVLLIAAAGVFGGGH